MTDRYTCSTPTGVWCKACIFEQIICNFILQAKGAGVTNHEIFDKISRARVVLPDDDKPCRQQHKSVRQGRAGSHQHIQHQGEKKLKLLSTRTALEKLC